jgi:hypothetical protein
MSCITRCDFASQAGRFPFKFHGEIDKRGHPFFGELLGQRNPDFVVHIPGEIGPEHNLCVIEVKPLSRPPHEVRKDATTLSLFLDHVPYHQGILLLFGESEERLRRVLSTALDGFSNRRGQIVVFWHPDVGQPARRIDW